MKSKLKASDYGKFLKAMKVYKEKKGCEEECLRQISALFRAGEMLELLEESVVYFLFSSGHAHSFFCIFRLKQLIVKPEHRHFLTAGN